MDGILDWLSGLGDWIQTGSGVAMFVTIAGIGVLLLLLALIFDSIFDFDDGPFSLTGIGSFLGAFGFSGWIALSSGLGVGWSALIGGIVGILCWVAAFYIVKLLRGKEPESISVEGYVGQSARVTTAIREAGIGEVVLNLRGEMLHLVAYADQPIALGKEVEIVSVRGIGSVIVKEKE